MGKEEVCARTGMKRIYEKGCSVVLPLSQRFVSKSESPKTEVSKLVFQETTQDYHHPLCGKLKIMALLDVRVVPPAAARRCRLIKLN
jgi:hypothetical protein